MENFVWRYQAVHQEFNNHTSVEVYEVLLDATTGEIQCLLTEDPVRFEGESIEDLMSMMANVQADIRDFGILTMTQLEESIERAAPAMEEMFNAESFPMENWDTLFNDLDAESDLLDEQFDEDGNVLDLVEFMKRNK